MVSTSACHTRGQQLESHPTPGFFIQNIHSKSNIEGMRDDMMMFPIVVVSGIVKNTISNTPMMDVRNSHGSGEC